MNSLHLKNTSIQRYISAIARVDRTDNGVRIYLSDYKGTTEETIAEAIDSILTNEDGSLTFVLPDGREIDTDPLIGPQGVQGEKGDTGDSGVYIGETEPTDPSVKVWIIPDGEEDE